MSITTFTNQLDLVCVLNNFYLSIGYYLMQRDPIMEEGKI